LRSTLRPSHKLKLLLKKLFAPLRAFNYAVLLGHQAQEHCKFKVSELMNSLYQSGGFHIVGCFGET